jgi:hypothetical protein
MARLPRLAPDNYFETNSLFVNVPAVNRPGGPGRGDVAGACHLQ